MCKQMSGWLLGLGKEKGGGGGGGPQLSGYQATATLYPTQLVTPSFLLLLLLAFTSSTGIVRFSRTIITTGDDQSLKVAANSGDGGG